MKLEEVRQFLNNRVAWLGQSGFLITTATGKTIYIDPFQLPANAPSADYLFLTHSHGDHYNPKAVAKIRTDKTRVVTPTDMAAIATDTLAVGEEKLIGEIGVKTFPAYNRRGFPHPRSKNWVGYLLSLDGVTVYHGGDTDSSTEITGMKPDVAFLPISGFMAFGIQDGADAAKAVGAAVTVPIHYGLIPGTKRNGEKFVRAYSGEAALLQVRPGT